MTINRRDDNRSDERRPSAAVRIEDSEDIYVGDGTFVGFDVGVDIARSKKVLTERNVTISPKEDGDRRDRS
jgi:hypothetical protein